MPRAFRLGAPRARVLTGRAPWRLVPDPVQLVLGTLVLWLPGLALTWALAPELDWAKFLAVSVVVALTVQPGIFYVLNVFFGIPITPANTILLALGLTALALAMAVKPRLERALA